MRKGVFICIIIAGIVLFATGYQMMGKANLLKSQLISNSVLYPEVIISSNQADVKGSITKIQNNQILVEEYPQKSQEGSKGLFTLDMKTKYFHQKNGKWIIGKKQDLKLGLNVLVWCRGFHTLMYPLRCTASHVVIDHKH